ncbi:MAG: HEAT repeat domain-containing protein [Prosthecobacter sp.]|nr:HEAT repeat domain-containing protein [Prosthecobacter sp.]
MPLPKINRYESMTILSEEVVRTYRQSIEAKDGEASLAVIHYRGGQTEFDLGRTYALSADPMDRVTGADVLAQLGWDNDSFHDESVELLLRLMTDIDDRVHSAAAIALGHRRSAKGVPVILPLIHHANPEVRLAVVHGLTGQEDPSAIEGLIALAMDSDREVRNWAAFNLGTISDADSPKLREALAPLLTDHDHEIRGEALIGLAKRQDPRSLPALILELTGKFHGSWCLEAAQFLRDPQLLPLLVHLRSSVSTEDRAAFSNDFDEAISACTN